MSDRPSIDTNHTVSTVREDLGWGRDSVPVVLVDPQGRVRHIDEIEAAILPCGTPVVCIAIGPVIED